jgi:hypothetical protein
MGKDDDKTESKSVEQPKMQAINAGNIKPPTELSWIGNMGENWRFFKQKFEIYLIASRYSTEESEFKIALLLNAVGDRALKIFNNFTYDSSVHFSFGNKKPEENIDQYVTELRDLSGSCNFGTLTDNLIRDRIVLGIRDRSIKDRLLRIKDLDLNKAMEICRAAERTKTQLADICPQGSEEVCKVFKSKPSKDGTGKFKGRPSKSLVSLIGHKVIKT